MDWKIYICDFLNNYLPTLELEEIVDLNKNKNKKNKTKKQKKIVSPTLPVSAVVHFYSFSTGHIKDQKNKRVWFGNTTITHCRPRPGWYYNAFYKTTRSIPFRTQIVCAKLYVRFSIFCPQRVLQQMNCSVVCWDDTLQMESSILLMGDVAYDARFSVCNGRNTLWYCNRT